MILGFFFEGSLISCNVTLVAILGSCYILMQPLFLLCIWKYTSVYPTPMIEKSFIYSPENCGTHSECLFVVWISCLKIYEFKLLLEDGPIYLRNLIIILESRRHSMYDLYTLFLRVLTNLIIFMGLKLCSVYYVDIDDQYVKCCIFVHSMMTRLCIWICIINHIEVFDWFNNCIW